MTGPRDRLIEAAYATGWRGVRALPLPAARLLFEAGADHSVRRGGPGIRRLAGNLRQVVGPSMPEAEFGALLRRAARSYARYWMEMFRLPSQSSEQLLAGFRLDNPDVFTEVMAAGRGVVLALPHAGNWDAAGAWVAASGRPIVTVAERLKPEGLFERFVAFRESLGMEILPLTGGRRAPLDVLAEKVTQGYVVPLLADRDLSARGVEVSFFGARTRMPPGPALLALRTGAPLYTVDMWFDAAAARGKLRGPIEVPPPEAGPLDVRIRLLTQRVADALAAGIARHPHDWHMLQRLWLDADERPGPRAAHHQPSRRGATDRGPAPSSTGRADRGAADSGPATAAGAPSGRA